MKRHTKYQYAKLAPAPGKVQLHGGIDCRRLAKLIDRMDNNSAEVTAQGLSVNGVMVTLSDGLAITGSAKMRFSNITALLFALKNEGVLNLSTDRIWRLKSSYENI